MVPVAPLVTAAVSDTGWPRTDELGDNVNVVVVARTMVVGSFAMFTTPPHETEA